MKHVDLNRNSDQTVTLEQGPRDPQTQFTLMLMTTRTRGDGVVLRRVVWDTCDHMSFVDGRVSDKDKTGTYFINAGRGGCLTASCQS